MIKSREEVKEEAKAAAAEEAPEPIDGQAIDDSLAEMGVDPDTAQAALDKPAATAPKKSAKKKK